MNRVDPPTSLASADFASEPYQLPSDQCQVDSDEPKHRPLAWRIYLLLHIAAVIAGAFASCDDMRYIRLPEGIGVVLTLASIPFLFISAGVLATMLGKAFRAPKKYGLFAGSELLLWVTHWYVLLPMVQ